MGKSLQNAYVTILLSIFLGFIALMLLQLSNSIPLGDYVLSINNVETLSIGYILPIGGFLIGIIAASCCAIAGIISKMRSGIFNFFMGSVLGIAMFIALHFISWNNTYVTLDSFGGFKMEKTFDNTEEWNTPIKKALDFGDYITVVNDPLNTFLIESIAKDGRHRVNEYSILGAFIMIIQIVGIIAGIGNFIITPKLYGFIKKSFFK